MTAPAVPGGALVVDTHNGGIDLAAADGGEITVNAVIEARAVRKSRAEKILADTRLVIQSTDGGVKISIAHPELGGSESVMASLDVAVPAGMTVEASTHNGHVAAVGLKADVKLRTHNGSVTVRDVEGAVAADTHNGSVDCSGSAGPLRVSTWNGSVRIACPKSARAPDITASTHNGGVRLDCPADLSATLDLRTVNGGVFVAAPMKTEVLKRNEVKGVVGAGEGRIVIETHNGSVRID
jgi:DUF4097 and DUF4098 domain-containing protein YvlB